MPLTAAGEKTYASFVKRYGKKMGRAYFYASINKGRLKRSKMEHTK